MTNYQDKYDYNYKNKYNFGKTRVWNPWRGCFQCSEACIHCYIEHLNTFKDCFYLLPPEYSTLPTGSVITVSLQSDFFLKEADKFREAAWYTIRKHPHLIFVIITKRIDRIKECLPEDWGDGWENVVIVATAENQKRADERIPILLSLPLKHKWVCCTPLLEQIDLTEYLKTGKIEHVEINGERSYKGETVRPLKIEWVKNLRDQCINYNTRVSFLFVGNNCILEDGSVIEDHCYCYGSEIADDLDISYYQPIIFNIKGGKVVY
jgi:protein gp37